MGNNHSLTMFYCLIVSFLFFSCSSKKQETNRIPYLEFNVDKELLAEESIENINSNYSIHVPKGWVEVKNNIKDKFLSSSYENSKLDGAFMNPVDSSLLFVVDVSKVQDSVFVNLRKNIETGNEVWNSVKSSQFRYSCFEFDQYLLENESIRCYRLISYPMNSRIRKANLEVLYFLYKNTFNNTIRSVESSIGSITCKSL